MKNTVFGDVKTRHFLLVVSGIALAFAVISCKTNVAPQTPSKTADSIQPSVSNQSVAVTETARHSKASYYTCGMHPEVRSLDPDGKCPMCQMPLLPAENVMVVDPDTGKTNTAANFPVVSGYYSCPSHPTVLSQNPEDKCPTCGKPLLRVENPAFLQGK